MEGYIKVYRKVMCNPVWQDPDLFRLWMYCLMKASHKERKVLVDKQEVVLRAGQFITGRFSLHQEFNNGIPPRKQTKDTTLWSWLKRLESMGNLDIKSYNKYSVVSILHWSEYQESLTTEPQQTDNSLTTEPQQTDTNNNVNNVKNENNVKKDKPSSPKQVYDEESIPYKLALRLYENILINEPSVKKPNLQKWANDMRLMMERDNRTEEQIAYLIDWCQNNSFWKSNILSPSKLREKFDQLVIKVKEEIKKQNKPVKQQDMPRAYQSLQDWADEA